MKHSVTATLLLLLLVGCASHKDPSRLPIGQYRVDLMDHNTGTLKPTPITLLISQGPFIRMEYAAEDRATYLTEVDPGANSALVELTLPDGGDTCVILQHDGTNTLLQIRTDSGLSEWIVEDTGELSPHY